MKTSIATLVVVLGLAASSGVHAAPPALNLTPTPVGATVTTIESNAYYRVALTSTGSGYDVTNGSYLGWCVLPSLPISDNTLYKPKLISSYSSNLPPVLQSAGWPSVNYLINHTAEYYAQGADWIDVQIAIWYLLDNTSPLDTALSETIATNAQAVGASFVPSAGQKIAVVLDFTDANGDLYVQDLIIEAAVSGQPGTVSGYVYVDLNDSKSKDAGDAPLPGVTMILSGTNYQGVSVLLTNVTDTNGFYSFSVPAGVYSISEAPTPGYFENPNTVGSLGGSISGDVISSIAVLSGSAGVNYNFGEIPPSSISGFNYVDLNNNGVFETNEIPIPGTTITLSGTNDLGQTVTLTAVTGTDGGYSFTGLRPGIYQVSEQQNTAYNYLQGKNTPGTFGGVTVGAVGATLDLLAQITIPVGGNGINYNFGELIPPSVVTPPQNAEVCVGGGAGFTVLASGTGVIHYQWRKDGNILTNGAEYSGMTNATLSISPANPGDAGAYDVVVTDDYGVVTSSAGVLTVHPLPVLTLSKTDVKCSGGSDGSVTVAISGALPATISLDGAAPQPASASQVFPGLHAGSHAVVVVGQYGCTAASSIQVGEPSAHVAIDSLSISNILCKSDSSGTLAIRASGGTGSYLYSIDGGNSYFTNNVFTNLSATNYFVVVSDQNGCLASVYTNLTEPDFALTINSVVKTDVTCKGSAVGSLTINASGGTGQIYYSINHGATYGTNNVFTGLVASNYAVVVVDANGCMSSEIVTISEPLAPVAINSVAASNILCKGSANGSILITASGGTGTLHYSIDGGTNYSLTNQFSGLAPGACTVVVSDDSGCLASQRVTLTEPAQPVALTLTATDASSKGNDGVIVATFSGGVGGYSISTNGGAFVPATSPAQFTGLSAGSYSIVLMDSNGCSALQTALIRTTSQLALLCPSNTAQIGVYYSSTLVTSGGKAPYSYSVINGALPPGLSLTNGTVSGTPTTAGAFSFTIQVTDSLGNTAVAVCTSCSDATTVTWNFDSPSGKLGASQSYTSGGIALTATGYAAGATPVPLYGKYSPGSTSDGLGIYGTANNEISTITWVQIDLRPLISAGGTNVSILLNGVQCSDGFNVYGSTNAGVLGTRLLANKTQGGVYLAVPGYPAYRYLNVNASSAGVLLSKLCASVPSAFCTITVAPKSLMLDCVLQTNGQIGVYYSSGMVASGGKSNYTYSIVSGGLPCGLSLNTGNGLITGTPTTAGIYTFTVRVKDSSGCGGLTTTATCSIKIAPAPLTLGCVDPNVAQMGVCYSATIPVSGGSGNRTFSIISGTLPTGLALNSSKGTISGTPSKSGTFNFTLKVVDSTSGTPLSATNSCSITVTGMPSPWKSCDIGCVSTNGWANLSGSCATVTGSGSDIWNCSDAFRYVYQSSSGDCSIVARVCNIQNTDPWAKAGICIRDGTGSGAVHASIFATPGNGVAFQWRGATGGYSSNANVGGISSPCWLKLKRVGNTFTACYSTNGSTWVQIGSPQSISMSSSATMGLGVTSHNDGSNCSAGFDNITATP